MRHFLWVILLGGVILPGLTASAAAAQDPAIVSPNNTKVEIENQWVRVLRVKLGPHEKTPPYDVPESIVVYVSNTDQKLMSNHGGTQEIHCKPGDVSHLDAGKHSQENLSDAPLEEILVELKPDAPKGEGLPPASLDPVKVEPQWVTVPFENDRVRVLHTILAPHFKNPLHAHPHNVVVFVTEPLTITTPDGKTVDNPRGPGAVRWVEATQHATTNNTDIANLEIQVELK